MACIHPHLLGHKFRSWFTSFHITKTIAPIPNRQLKTSPQLSTIRTLRSSARSPVIFGASGSSFTWDDVVQVSLPEYAPHDSTDLSGFLDKIKYCNRGYVITTPESNTRDNLRLQCSQEMKSDFLPFVIEDLIVGYIHHGFVEHLTRFKDVFAFPQSDYYGGRFGSYVALHNTLDTPEKRTGAVDEVIKCLGEEQLVPGIRNELYPVTPYFGAPVYFSLERAAAPYFGIKAYGVHMSGYVERDGEEFLWIGKRSPGKPTFPGMLDHLVAGGLPHGISPGKNLIKECEEEAGIPQSLSDQAIPVGAVSYSDIDGDRYKRDVLFCYDLRLPESFIPKNQDGEVESFKLIPAKNVANVIRRTQFFKPNCSLVIIDFLFRHGHINPECPRYLELLQNLRRGDCS